MSPSRFIAWFGPVMTAKQWLTIAVATLLGALVAGLHGAAHDQITYTLSPEYFTAMKFPQFQAEGWPLPSWGRAALIGFLTSWWLGAAIGFLLARITIAGLSKHQACRQFAVASALILLCTTLFGLIGGSLSYFETVETRQQVLQEWSDYQITYDLIDLPSFVQVAEVHRASYLGVAVGLLAAICYLGFIIWRRGLGRVAPHLPEARHPANLT